MTYVIAFHVGLAYPTDPGTGREKKPRGKGKLMSKGDVTWILQTYRSSK